MKDNGTFTQKLERFLAGRGFYLVLAACVLVIGFSAWSLYSSGVFERTPSPLDVGVNAEADNPVQQKKPVIKSIFCMERMLWNLMRVLQNMRV